MLSLISRNIPSKFKPDQGYTKAIKSIIDHTLENPNHISSVIGGEKVDSRKIEYQLSPINNNKTICSYTNLTELQLKSYIENYPRYKESLNALSNRDISDIFRKASDLLVKKYREQMIAYTIVSQGKSMYEAEIDAVCELADFWNFNVDYKKEILAKQPLSTEGIYNKSIYRPLNGFVTAITPFNFTAIGGNLASAPVMFRNTVAWKPAKNAILSNKLVYDILIEAGLPYEAISFMNADPHLFSKTMLSSPDLGGLLFTGSSSVFDSFLKRIYGSNCGKYKSYPRVIGETGGKNWHFITKDLNYSQLVSAANLTISSAFGYSGQKCSACSIVYVPNEIYEDFLGYLNNARYRFMEHDSFKNYGLINRSAFLKTETLINSLKRNNKCEILSGGFMSEKPNYYIEPTIVRTKNNDHNHDLFNSEFFAPILAVYTYDDLEETMELCRTSNNYALTGSVFSNNKKFNSKATDYFSNKCGNFYINDKSTGSIVGNQPFGGSGRSGTNDKAGDINFLYKLFNQQTVKTNLYF